MISPGDVRRAKKLVEDYARLFKEAVRTNPECMRASEVQRMYELDESRAWLFAAVLLHSENQRLLEQATAALNVQPTPIIITDDRLTMFRTVIDLRLNNRLVEMKPEYDDSITGFNEAWNIVREAFKEVMS